MSNVLVGVFPRIATALACTASDGFPPTKVTVGAKVYPAPPFKTTIPETRPFEMYACASAPVPTYEPLRANQKGPASRDIIGLRALFVEFIRVKCSGRATQSEIVISLSNLIADRRRLPYSTWRKRQAPMAK